MSFYKRISQLVEPVSSCKRDINEHDRTRHVKERRRHPLNIVRFVVRLLTDTHCVGVSSVTATLTDVIVPVNTLLPRQT